MFLQHLSLMATVILRLRTQVCNRPATACTLHATVSRQASLVVVQQPTTCFAQAKCQQSVSVQLEDASSSLCLVDWYTAGRGHAQDGNWQFDSFQNEVVVSMGGDMCDAGSNNDFGARGADIIYRDAISLRGGDELSRQMRGFNTIATVLLCGPRLSTTVGRLLDDLNGRKANMPPEFEQQCGPGGSGGAGTLRGSGMFVDGMLLSMGQGPIPGSAVRRLASRTMEQAARFLSAQLGTLDGWLQQDMFDEIVHVKSKDLAPSMSPEVSLAAHVPSNHSKGPASAGLAIELSLAVLSGDDKILKAPLTATAEVSGAPEAPGDGSHSCNRGSGSAKHLNGTDIAALTGTDPEIDAGGDPAANLVVWQLVDASLPTGGFAHSGGLEAALQLGMLTTEGDVLQYIWNNLIQAATELLPFVSAAHQVVSANADGAGQREDRVSNTQQTIPHPQNRFPSHFNLFVCLSLSTIAPLAIFEVCNFPNCLT